MKSLNKVIFINSANMRYEEIVLDGNAHLAGLPGVGKTTIQRAILYFFTANQLKLGIDSSKQKFMQFYLPGRDSHIVYEFRKEDYSFCVILIDSGHGIQYGFVDAPYSVDWIINPVTGICAEMWSDITKNIPRHIDRDLVTSIKEYLSILWGNNSDRRYDRYCIAKSKGYENLIKSLQSIFLCSGFSLSAFKTNLVMQLDDIKPSVNLSQLRSRLEDFEAVTRDMSTWSEVCRNDGNDTKKTADGITGSYYSYIETGRQMRKFLVQLYRSVKNDHDKIPSLEREHSKLVSDAGIIENEIKETEENYKQQAEVLKAELVIKKNLLETIEKKKKEYSDIDMIIREVSNKPALEKEKAALNSQLTILRQENRSIEDKYTGLLNTLKEGFLNIAAEISDSMETQRNLYTREIEELKLQKRKSQDSIKATYRKKISQAETQIKGLNELLLEKSNRLAVIKATHFFADEIQSKRNEIGRIEMEISSISNEITNHKRELEDKRKEGIEEEKRIKSIYTEEKEKAEKEISVIDSRISEIDSMLSKYDDSFYSWLQSNKKDQWMDTIGRVVDETILYRTDLQPEIIESEGNTSLYGVRLMTENIDVKSLSPADLEKEVRDLSKKKENISSELNAKAIVTNASVEENKQKFSKMIVELRETIAKKEFERNGKSIRISSLNEEIADLETKSVSEKNVQVETISVELSEIRKQITDAENILKGQREEQESALQAIDKWLEDSSAEKKKTLDDFINEKNQLLNSEKTKYNTKEKEYQKQKQSELSGKGVDISGITALESSLAVLNNKLLDIKAKEERVLYYHKDKEEYIDHEQEYRVEISTSENKLSMIATECSAVTKPRKDKLEVIKARISTLNDTLDKIREGLDKFNREKAFLPTLRQSEETEAFEDTDSSVIELLENYRNSREEKMSIYKSLKHNITIFRKKFQSNIFNLPSKFEIEEDFLRYAKELSDIINLNIIENYRMTQKDIYIRTLTGIRLSMDDLKKDMNTIKGKVAEIDNVFKVAKMPKVIRELRLRTTDTKDYLYDILLRIRDFVETNESMLGGIDLFTSKGDFEKVKEEMFDLLATFIKTANQPGYFDRNEFTLEDMFDIEVKVTENGETHDWTNGLNGMIGSTATDIMVKMLLNTVLVSISMSKAIKESGLYLHCCLDESDRIHLTAIKDVLDFCTDRHIFYVMSSPHTIDFNAFKRNYEIIKDERLTTHIQLLVGKENINFDNYEVQ